LFGFEKTSENLSESENVLLHERATKEEIENLLKKYEIDFQKNIKSSNSLFVIYFSGHGQKEGDDFYLCPHDYDANLPDTTLKMQSFIQLIQNLNCKHIVIFLDCCYSGGIFV
jgi:uncharacterized caspase-like protein